MAKREELVVGLDIGTTKIAAIVGEVTDEGIDIIGVGTHPSTGLKKGVVVNIDATVQSIQRAVEEAEHMAGVEITQVYAGIAGAHIKSLNSQGVWAVKDKEVKESDIAAVLEQAKAINIPQDREIIHVLPQEYTIDHQDGIKEPLGMSGVRLEAKVHLVTASVTSAQNIIKCCHRCGLQVADVVLEPLASAEAVLHDDEKELGVALIDIGGGTTDVAIFTDGAIVHTSVLAVGGHQLTGDIAYGLRSPHSEAERIKHKHGCAMVALVGEDEMMEVPSVGGRPARQVKRQLLMRCHRAARRRDLHAGQARAGEERLRGQAGLGRRHHRRLDAARRDDRIGRGRARHAGAARHSQRRRRAGRRRQESFVRDGRGPGALRHAQPEHDSLCRPRRRQAQRVEAHAQLVRRSFLARRAERLRSPSRGQLCAASHMKK